MAILYITEYAEMVSLPAGRVGQMPSEPPLVEQTLVMSGISAQSQPFNAATRFVRLHTDSICAVTFGLNPTATVASGTSGSGRMIAGQTEYHALPPRMAGDTSYMVAGITTT